MPVSHFVDQELGILVVTREGKTSADEEEQSFHARDNDPAIAPGLPVLVDSRRVDPPDSVTTVRRMANIVQNNAQRLRCTRTALLVGSDVQYGMARMYMALTEPIHPDTAVFRDYDEALNWLLEGQETTKPLATPGAGL